MDGTIGGGGHAESIVQRISPQGTLIGFDRDSEALQEAERRLRVYGDRIVLVHDNFTSIRNRLSDMKILFVDGVLLDLGVSSYQIDSVQRGFSFQADGRLDMRMDRSQKLDASVVVNTYDEDRLATILKEYGEEKNARKISGRIVEMRRARPIDSTRDLARIIEKVSGGRFLTKTLARVFQAIRIEVNDEIASLRHGLRAALEVLKPGGRLVVLSYHSLEDRLVKQTFQAESRTIIPSGSKLVPDTIVEPRIKILTKKTVTASERERALNPRSRSAKLRAVERTGEKW